MKIAFAFLIVFCAAPLMAQNTPDLQQTYALKINKFKKMKSSGVVMTIVGSAMTIAGIMVLGEVDESHINSSGQTVYDNDPRFVSGALLVTGGILLATPGIVLWSIGSSKQRSYQRRLDGLALNLKLSPSLQGLSLAYRFHH